MKEVFRKTDLKPKVNNVPLIRLTKLEKENLELRHLIEAFSENLRRQGDWKDHYQKLSEQHAELRNQLFQRKKKISPKELALRYHWKRPNLYRRGLDQKFNEQELENYIWYQLERLEPGLRFCGHQVVCGNNIIDIVAENRTGKHVLIELKVTFDDPRLVGQVLNYLKSYCAQFDVYEEDIRVLVIAPGYSQELLRNLRGLGVIPYKYEIEEGWLEIEKI